MQLFCGWENFSLSPSTRRPLGQGRVCAFYKQQRLEIRQDNVASCSYNRDKSWKPCLISKFIDILESRINSCILTWRQMGGWWAWCWVCRLPPCTVSIWTGSLRLLINIVMVIIILFIVPIFIAIVIFDAIEIFFPVGKSQHQGLSKTRNRELVHEIRTSLFCTQLYFFKRLGLVLVATCASEVDPCSPWLRSVRVPSHNQLQPLHIQDLFCVLFCPSSSSFFSLFLRNFSFIDGGVLSPICNLKIF